jgi:hypothetical protein
MLQPNPYLVQGAAALLLRRSQDYTACGARSALSLYQRARRRGRIWRVWSVLTGRARDLLNLNAVERDCVVCGRRYAGTLAVPLDRIRGSEGRYHDFDRSFYPLRSHERDRWLGIAAAQWMGLPLPPVELVQVGDVYFVRDGHHRISVARMRGQRAVDAVVTVWDVAGPLPWEQEASAGVLAGQPV